jgi:hypothetical protein
LAYETPQVKDLGKLVDLTQQNFNKNPGASDTVTIAGVTTPIPGSGLAP